MLNRPGENPQAREIPKSKSCAFGCGRTTTSENRLCAYCHLIEEHCQTPEGLAATRYIVALAEYANPIKRIKAND